MFRIYFPNDIPSAEMQKLLAMKSGDVDELCPSQNHWTFVAKSDKGRSFLEQLMYFHPDTVKEDVSPRHQELPGMWESADLIGGKGDDTNYDV